MITEAFLRTHDRWVKYLTGLTAPQFWAMFSRIEADFEAYERQRHERPGRKRAVGAGRPFAVPLLIRVVAVIAYLRLHLAQEFTGMWFGIDQVQISRDLRRLLPLIRRHVPAPQVLELPEEERPANPLEALQAAFGEEGIALLDTTEQPVNRPKDVARQRAFYSGKKKRHTVKTQIVTNSAGDIAAITPPVPGKTADIKLAEPSRVVERLPDRALGRVRIQVEHAIGRAKNWHILADRFRCHLDIYEEVFRTISGFANLQAGCRRLAMAVA